MKRSAYLFFDYGFESDDLNGFKIFGVTMTRTRGLWRGHRGRIYVFVRPDRLHGFECVVLLKRRRGAAAVLLKCWRRTKRGAVIALDAFLYDLWD